VRPNRFAISTLRARTIQPIWFKSVAIPAICELKLYEGRGVASPGLTSRVIGHRARCHLIVTQRADYSSLAREIIRSRWSRNMNRPGRRGEKLRVLRATIMTC